MRKAKDSSKVRKLSSVLPCIFRLLLLGYLGSVLYSLATMESGPRPDITSATSLDHFDRDLEALSSVDYFACCGLGHRLIRMSLAHYVAKVQGLALRSFWGWCGERQPIEVFSYLFAPTPRDELRHVVSRNLVLPFYNEVGGFQPIVRTPNATVCPCHQDKIDADYEMYRSLRDRFRGKQQVDEFIHQHFEGHTVVGIHVRAGNGETGDFEKKGRQIENPQEWVQQVCKLILDFLQQERPKLPPLLYIATDTPSMVALFSETLRPANIPVLELPQQRGRRHEGQGVMFGVSHEVHNKDESNDEDDYSACLKGWVETLTDMFLLSHADVVIAAKPSSFSQTAPMSLAFGNKQRKLSKSFCEVIPPRKTNESPWMQCSDTYHEWCCGSSAQPFIKFQVGSRKKDTEFVRFLKLHKLSNFSKEQYPSMRNRSIDCPRPRRGRAGGGLKDKCLPHRW